MPKTIGRIALFVSDSEAINAPKFRGVMETPKGKYTVSLWEEPNEKVTGGYMLKGQVVDTKEDK